MESQLFHFVRVCIKFVQMFSQEAKVERDPILVADLSWKLIELSSPCVYN